MTLKNATKEINIDFQLPPATKPALVIATDDKLNPIIAIIGPIITRCV